MTVSLSPELERLVAESVATGKYGSANDVIHEALRLLRERDERLLEELRHEIAIGLAEADRGELAPLDTEAIQSEARRLHSNPPLGTKWDRSFEPSGPSRPLRHLELHRHGFPGFGRRTTSRRSTRVADAWGIFRRWAAVGMSWALPSAASLSGTTSSITGLRMMAFRCCVFCTAHETSEASADLRCDG